MGLDLASRLPSPQSCHLLPQARCTPTDIPPGAPILPLQSGAAALWACSAALSLGLPFAALLGWISCLPLSWFSLLFCWTILSGDFPNNEWTGGSYIFWIFACLKHVFILPSYLMDSSAECRFVSSTSCSLWILKILSVTISVASEKSDARLIPI